MSKDKLLALIDEGIEDEELKIESLKGFQFEPGDNGVEGYKENLAHWREIRGIVEESGGQMDCDYAKGFEEGYGKGYKQGKFDDTMDKETPDVDT